MMKYAVPAVLAVWVFTQSIMAQEDRVQDAVNAFEEAEYQTTIDILESLVAEGKEDGDIFLNLGHAYFQIDDFGQAMLNYLRAQQYIPRDFELQTQIVRLRANRIDIQGDTLTLVELIGTTTNSLLTLTELAWLVWLSWVIWFLLFVLYRLRKAWRELLRVLILVMGLMLVGAGFLLGTRLWLEENRPIAVAIVSETTAMSGPGESYLSYFPLHAAAEVRVLETRLEWMRILLPDGRQGWVHQDTIELVYR